MIPTSLPALLVDLVKDLVNDHPLFRTALSLVALAVAMFLVISFAWHFGIEVDNDELNAGKSPHSGFCTDFPDWE